MDKKEIIKKLAYALAFGVCVGLMASWIEMIKGLKVLETLGYFLFWIGVSLAASFTSFYMQSWLRGFLVAEIFSMPFVILTMGSYKGESLSYMLISSLLFNGFFGMSVGYLNGLVDPEEDKVQHYVKGVARKVGVSALSGVMAGMIQIIPMTLTGARKSMVISALIYWIALSIIISFVNARAKGWLIGLVTAELSMLPLTLLYYYHDPWRIIPMIITSGIIGAALGAFNIKYTSKIYTGASAQ